jgi:hypothetical protein
MKDIAGRNFLAVDLSTGKDSSRRGQKIATATGGHLLIYFKKRNASSSGGDEKCVAGVNFPRHSALPSVFPDL